ncbi:MAG: hypothetical protein FGM57_03340 [Candidatus Taylorbacteria bacterium]|nr:hypothetical protein [Candidatus Taylorbacteria bacterium]
MADKKAPPKPSGSAEGQMIFVALIAVMLVFVILPTVALFFGVSTEKLIPDDVGQKAGRAFDAFIEGVTFISVFIAFVIALLIFYSKMQYNEITTAYKNAQKAKEDLQNRVAEPAYEPVGIVLPGTSSNPQFGVVPSEPDPRWAEITRHIESHNQSDWRIAIIEADILLQDMLTQMGYQGTSIGEMLKQVDPQNFLTLDDAWKAHKIRNMIAHGGTGYELTREEAERAIRMYQRVFEEFYFI